MKTGWLPAALCGSVLLACTGLGPDPLTRLRPMIWAGDGEVWLVRCRWPDGARVTVSLPEDAGSEGAGAMAAAVGSWSRAGLPITLDLAPVAPVAPAGRADIEVVWADQLDGPEGRGRKGEAQVDCRREPDGSFALAQARVQVARAGRDPLGRAVAQGPEALAGVALHEIGHALGFAGHVPGARDEPMDAAFDSLERLGRRVLRGEAVRSRALAALYARPSGSVVARRRVEPWRTGQLDALRALGGARDWRGPFLRVGDTGVAIWWATGQGAATVRAANPDVAFQDPSQVIWIPDAPARCWLAVAREPGSEARCGEGETATRGGSRPPDPALDP